MLKRRALQITLSVAALLPAGLTGCQSSPWSPQAGSAPGVMPTLANSPVPPPCPGSYNNPTVGPATLQTVTGQHSHTAGQPCPHCHVENPLSKPIEVFGMSSADVTVSQGQHTSDRFVHPVSYNADDPNCCPPQSPMSPFPTPQLPAPGTSTGGHFIPGDELICDGGDEGIGVAVDSEWTVRGLDSEDTVAHFDTLSGERRIEASNRVCIYAPRFGSVRKTYGIASNANFQQLAGVDNQIAMVEIEEVDITSTTLQQLQPRGQVGSKSPSTFRDRTRGMELENRVASAAFKNRFATFEDLSIIRFGIFKQGEKARLAEGLTAAESWGRIEAPQAVIDNLTVDSIGTGVPAAETVLVEKPEGKPELRIVKVASAKEALPGDVIEFTLRFDNVGNETIGNVTLLDHLSPRVEVIDGSAECNVKADFFVTEQDRGTQVFRAEIVEPLPAGQGGIVRFKCRVR